MLRTLRTHVLPLRGIFLILESPPHLRAGLTTKSAKDMVFDYLGSSPASKKQAVYTLKKEIEADQFESSVALFYRFDKDTWRNNVEQLAVANSSAQLYERQGEARLLGKVAPAILKFGWNADKDSNAQLEDYVQAATSIETKALIARELFSRDISPLLPVKQQTDAQLARLMDLALGLSMNVNGTSSARFTEARIHRIYDWLLRTHPAHLSKQAKALAALRKAVGGAASGHGAGVKKVQFTAVSASALEGSNASLGVSATTTASNTEHIISTNALVALTIVSLAASWSLAISSTL
eukprot:m.222367 g.222367  ORF g.222367 m.222367 type:complete len:295 (-) comp16015_c0_seq1:42-926(-)